MSLSMLKILKKGFRPLQELIVIFHIPGVFEVRIDTTLYQGYQMSSHYMIQPVTKMIINSMEENQ